jgi:hypothetical protein
MGLERQPMNINKQFLDASAEQDAANCHVCISTYVGTYECIYVVRYIVDKI